MKIDLASETLEIDEKKVREPEEEIRRQLKQFLDGERKEFDLNFTVPRSFTGKVMDEILKIPYGNTRTYGEIASDIQSSAVAVGQACGKNPLPIIVPCHRVTGKNSPGGYNQRKESEVKQLLLELEKTDF